MNSYNQYLRSVRVGAFNELQYWPNPVTTNVTVSFILLETGDKLLLEDGTSFLLE